MSLQYLLLSYFVLTEAHTGIHVSSGRYFSINTRENQAASLSLGPYDDPARMLLPFKAAEFVRGLRTAHVPPGMSKTKWHRIYSAFCASPSFYPWFNSRRKQVAHNFKLTLELYVPIALCVGPAGAVGNLSPLASTHQLRNSAEGCYWAYSSRTGPSFYVSSC